MVAVFLFMAAPLENRFWELRSKHGRDRLFETPELLWEAACEYFKWCEDNPLIEIEQSNKPAKAVKNDDGTYAFPPNHFELPKMRAFTMAGLCRYLHCNTKYFNDFKDAIKIKEDDLSKGFSEVITSIYDTLYEQKFTGAAAGFLNANLISRELGLSDSNVLKGDKDAPLATKFDITLNLNK
jgi:hypothetical protein